MVYARFLPGENPQADGIFSVGVEGRALPAFSVDTLNGVQIFGAPLGAGSADYVNAGQIVPVRNFNQTNITPAGSGALSLTFFTGDKNELISMISFATRTTAAGATPTLCKMGVYQEASNGDLTKIAETANDTTLFGATNTQYTRALTSSFSKVVGQRYATALLVVTAATMPTFHGLQLNGTNFTNFLNALTPRNMGVVFGQTDLPASIASASISAQQFCPVCYLS